MLLFRKNDHLGENRSEAWGDHFRLENQQPVHRIDFLLCCSNSTKTALADELELKAQAR